MEMQGDDVDLRGAISPRLITPERFFQPVVFYF